MTFRFTSAVKSKIKVPNRRFQIKLRSFHIKVFISQNEYNTVNTKYQAFYLVTNSLHFDVKSNTSKIAVLTLGCAKNIVDSEELLEQIDHSDYTVTKNAANADVVVINTCGFIQDAKKESIETILQSVELKKQGKLKKVIVMGCLSERYKSELQKEIPEVDAFIGANKINSVTKKLGIDFKCELLGERHLTTPRHYAYLKIAEGCDNPCSFCAIPLMRGKHVSKPIERVIKEAQRLAALGVKELILIAQDTTYYGLDLYGRRSLKQLLGKLGNVDGVEWIRLMYAFPAKFPEKILDVFIDNDKLCKYIDMPVQHISDNILKSMRRDISSCATYKLIDKIRKKVPGIALRTSLIVGYPNETDKEFQELIDFVKEVEFDRLGVFTYSIEEDTHAFGLGDPVSDDEKQTRRNMLMEIQSEISYKKNQSFTGKKIRILVDSKTSSTAFCRSEYDAPEVDNEVIVESADKMKIGN
ncbi:MAG: 30S ribosomal protein S12 methylthiotransferase RimO, partial [Bacteroidetes bacterium]|nr:30S ribosomal protein S12 methylthiotransferase RimO [Bacteroidota bacterium]MBU1421584.1 30S ribosomal protein S12 methylthiotransferase RimO [Bacteroidota bacterium]